MQQENERFLDILNGIELEFCELETLISSVEIMSDNKLYNHYLAKYKKIEDIAKNYRNYKNIENDIIALTDLLNTETNEDQIHEIENQLSELNDRKNELFALTKNCYLESLNKEEESIQIEVTCKEDFEFLDYLKDLFSQYFLKNNFDFNKEDDEEKFVMFASGENIYKNMNYFNGKIKRVFRGKETFASIAILKTIQTNNEIDEDDLIIQTSKSSGAGGQHINKTESAVKIIHKPTGIFAECQDERSQTKNKEKALARLKEKIEQKNAKKIKNNEENQRKIIKSKIFSETSAVVFDFDRNIIMVSQNKKEYKLKEIQDGNLQIIGNDINI